MTKGAVSDFVDRIEEAVAGALLLAVMAVTAYNVVNRYLLQQSAAWAPELAGFLFTWVVFVGAAAAARRGMHVSVGVVMNRLPPRLGHWTREVGDLILIGFFAYALWLSLKISVSSYSRVSPAMHLPFTFVYLSVVVCFSLCLARSLAAMLERWRPKPHPTSEV